MALFQTRYAYRNIIAACPFTANLERAKREADRRPLGHVVEVGTGRLAPPVYVPPRTMAVLEATHSTERIRA